MSGIGAKLSRHVLGMKFMRKTKDQIDKERIEKVHREHFGPSSSATGNVKTENICGAKNESIPEAASTSSLLVEELWSYNQCERYLFGRQSFGGFNPTVENNVKKGIWKPFYLEDSENPQDDEEEEVKTHQSDVDVSDEEMAKTYGSIVGTLAKHFKRKHKREGDLKKGNRNDDPGNDQNNKKRSRWNKKFGKFKNDRKPQQQYKEIQSGSDKSNRKRQRESTGSNYGSQQERASASSWPKRSSRSANNSNDDVPAPKKRKFLKPSDD